jgi:hypothetical protein
VCAGRHSRDVWLMEGRGWVDNRARILRISAVQHDGSNEGEGRGGGDGIYIGSKSEGCGWVSRM